MVRSMPWKMALIALCTFISLATLAGRSSADDSEGIVRICDQVPGQTGAAANCPQGSGHGGYAVSGCPNCQPGHPCRSHCGYGSSGHGCFRCGGHVHQFLDWFNPHGMCTHSPDHGYAPPGKMHTPHPQQVAYQKGFPDAWVGQQAGPVGGPRAVSIYMPTDTTQLGYYYQAVPRWHAYRGMVPPTPVPSEWHRELCQQQACQHCRGQAAGNCPHCRGQAHEGQGERHIQEQLIEAQPQPAPVVDPMPNPADPAPGAPVEPAPAPAPLEKAELPNLQPIN